MDIRTIEEFYDWAQGPFTEALLPEELPAALQHVCANLVRATSMLTRANRNLCETLVLRLVVAHCIDLMLSKRAKGAISEHDLAASITRGLGGYAHARHARAAAEAEGGGGAHAGATTDWQAMCDAATRPLIQLGALRQQLSVRGFTDDFSQGYAALAQRFRVHGESLARWIVRDASPSEQERAAADEVLGAIRQGLREAGGGSEAPPRRSVPSGWSAELLEALEGAPFAFATARM